MPEFSVACRFETRHLHSVKIWSKSGIVRRGFGQPPSEGDIVKNKVKSANGRKLHKLPLYVALASCLYGSVAMAQDAPAKDQADHAVQAKKKVQNNRKIL